MSGDQTRYQGKNSCKNMPQYMFYCEFSGQFFLQNAKLMESNKNSYFLSYRNKIKFFKDLKKGAHGSFFHGFHFKALII